ncbi:MAG: PKD domain-containing protein [Flavobacteriales bacterium]|nr:PKD domain-containing protein [Flavobacteriales bacterium]
MKNFIPKFGIALLLLMGTMTSYSQFLFPPGSEIIFPSLSVINDDQEELPDIFYIPPAAVAAPLVESITSGPWHSSLTWNCNCIPDEQHDVLIAADHEVLITADASCTSLFINEDATLTVQEGDLKNLYLTGDWTNDGEFVANSSVVHVTTIEERSFSGQTTFNQLRLNGTGTYYILSEVEVNELLGIAGPTVQTNSRLSLVLNGTELAQIAPIFEGEIAGEITYESLIGSNTTGWLNIGAPFSDATIMEWNDDFITTGFEGSDYPAYSFVNIQTYNEQANSDDDSYLEIQSANDIITPGVGYYVYVNPGLYDFDAQGTPNQGEFEFDLSYTDNGDLVNDGLNLLANPYAATINWDQEVGWNKQGLDGAIYIWDVDLRQFKTYINGYGINGGSPAIRPTETFWVQANSPNPTLTVSELAKDINYEPADVINENYLSLEFSNGTATDEMMIVFDETASADFEPTKDALKFKSGSSSLSIGMLTESETILAINSVPAQETIIPLTLDLALSGTYTISVDHFPVSDPGFCMVLEDTQTGWMYAITEGEVFTFQEDAITEYERFRIRIGDPLQVESTGTVCFGQSNGSIEVQGVGDGPWNYTFMDDQGTVVSTQTEVAGPATAEGLNEGVYDIVVTNNELCNVLNATMTLVEGEEWTFDIGTTDLECGETTAGAIMGVPEGGTGPFMYFLDNDPTSQLTEGLAAGVYEYGVMDGLGCYQSETVEVFGAPNVFASFVPSAQTILMEDGEATVTFTNTTEGGTTFIWDFGDNFGTIGENVEHTYMNPGLYEVTLTASNGECSDQFTLVINVEAVDNISENALENVQLIHVDGGVKLDLGSTSDFLQSVRVLNSIGQEVALVEKDFNPIELLELNTSPGVFIVLLDYGTIKLPLRMIKG